MMLSTLRRRWQRWGCRISWRLWVVLPAGLALCLAGCSITATPGSDVYPPNQTGNPWSVGGEWYSGNLHAHSSRSDGVLSPQDLVDCYRAGNYDFLAISDHNQIAPVNTLNAHGMCLLPAVEWTAHTPAGREFHLLAVGATALPGSQTPAVDAVNFFRSQGAVPFVAHPNSSGLPAADMLALFPALCGIEVFNGMRGTSLALWDELLRQGARPWGFACDDNHDGALTRGKGWVVVRAAALTPDALLASLENGYFYATSGPVLSRVQLSTGAVQVQSSACVKITCFTPSGSQKVTGSITNPVRSAIFPLSGNEEWLRIEAEDGLGRTAWSNPLHPLTVHNQGSGYSLP